MSYNGVTENGDAGFHMTGGTSGSTGNNISYNNIIANGVYGIWLESLSNDNLIYNNFFNNTNNAYDDGNNQWNTTKTSGTNIIGGHFLGGNYWSDYAGADNDGDGLGDTLTPYSSYSYITTGGDYHPLVSAAAIPRGDICVNETGWWRDGGAFNASRTPIQAAVDNANAGETICVAAGSYTENVNVDKRLTLRGEGADVVTVTAANSGDHVFNVTAGHVNISGFNVTGATAGYPYHYDYAAGIYLNGADHCNISENTASNNSHGIYLDSSSNNMLASNTANSNNRYGIYLRYSSNNTLANNTASGNNDGIRLSVSSNNTLANNTASNNDKGIYLGDSSNNMLESNNADSNDLYGIWLYGSSDNTLASNTMSENMYNFGVLYNFVMSGSSLSECTQNIDTSNTVDGKPIYYWVGQKDRQIPSDAGFVGVVNGTNITVRDLTLTNNGKGVLFAYTENSRIENVTTANNSYGIILDSSSNNTLASNTANLNNNRGIYLLCSSNNTLASNNASSNYDGIRLDSSSNNTLANNTANSNNQGIWLVSSSSNTLASNTASNNCDGVHLQSSCDNDVTCNLMQNNTDCGIYLTSGSTGNNITWNNIVANGELQTDGSYHYQFKNSQSDGVDAINNFWGAGMNNSTIDASIYKMGSAVAFYPFETEPVPCAPTPISEESSAFTTADAVIALRIAVGSRPLDLRYDVSGDKRVTSLDAMMIAMDTRTG